MSFAWGAATVIWTVFMLGLVCKCLLSKGIFMVGAVAPGAARPVFTAVFAAHVVAALMLPLLIVAAYVPVWRQHWNVHRRVGKLALPVWLFVSVSGLLAYLLG